MKDMKDLPVVMSVMALLILLCLYPAFMIGIGAFSNAKLPGLMFLTFGTALAWGAFVLQKNRRWLCRLLHMPATILLTAALVHELLIHWFTEGRWLTW